MAKQTELEKKTEELALLRAAKAMSWRRLKLDLPMVHWPALAQCQRTDEREVALVAELEKLGTDTTQIAPLRDPKWVDQIGSGGTNRTYVDDVQSIAGIPATHT